MEENGKTVTDPHVWNSAANVVVWVANIEKALPEADPEDSADFKANAARYARELQDSTPMLIRGSASFRRTSARS